MRHLQLVWADNKDYHTDLAFTQDRSIQQEWYWSITLQFSLVKRDAQETELLKCRSNQKLPSQRWLLLLGQLHAWYCSWKVSETAPRSQFACSHCLVKVKTSTSLMLSCGLSTQVFRFLLWFNPARSYTLHSISLTFPTPSGMGGEGGGENQKSRICRLREKLCTKTGKEERNNSNYSYTHTHV